MAASTGRTPSASWPWARTWRPRSPVLKSRSTAMDKAKLEALRARYEGGGAFDATDPVLKAAASQVRRADGQRTLPYSGVPTFLGLPYAQSAAGLDIAAVGIPMDLGVSNRTGARFGPRAVRTIERSEERRVGKEWGCRRRGTR